MSGATLAVIPARLGSTRLPRKPLHIIAGRPLVEWVWRRATATPLFDRVVIATDSEEIAEHARSFGAEVELTSPLHPSGTDRVAEVARRFQYRDYPLIVNVQGDEPFIEPEHLAEAVRLVRDDGWDIGTVASGVESRDEWKSASVVKVVRGMDGGALYFSRSPIPHVRGSEPTAADFATGEFLRHIGVYAYRAEALQRWVDLPEGTLERLERLEQLRPLAGGLRIGVSVAKGAGGGIDTLEDAERAELRLRTA
ncbi:MAG TPA: 3-deoxy-manno-octulosonate cytidylyltransferase [Longimicrobiaceae bacterium]|nr:3-deoxy-manno-octulosonate cytidylyltransferase [Longimicrobiaceae bacterium]